MTEIKMLANRDHLVIRPISARSLPVFAIRKPQESFFINKGAVEVYEAFWKQHFKSRYKLNRVMFSSRFILIATTDNRLESPVFDSLLRAFKRNGNSSFVFSLASVDLSDFFSNLNNFALGFLSICNDPYNLHGVTYENVMRRSDVNFSGVGSSLMNAANGLVVGDGFYDVRLTCTSEKPLLSGGSSLREFYEKWGFREEK